MAYVGASDDFDLDDDGILRDSMSGTDLLMDDDGIVRDDDLDMYKHVTRGHWTDSGIGGDKQSSTSTLQHLQNSFEEDLAPIGDESINISEFEASKDDLSFDRQDGEMNGNDRKRGKKSPSLDLLDTLGSTLDKPGDYEDEPPKKQDRKGANNQTAAEYDQLVSEFDNHQLFSEEYYKQLRDLGVLVDGVDLSRDSLNEFEETESRVASRMDDDPDDDHRDTRDLIGEYLDSEYRKEQEEEEEEEDQPETETPRREGDEGDPYSRASSARTISSRSFPDDSEDYEKENISQNLGGQGGSQSQRTTGDDEEIYYITSHMSSAAAEGKRGRQQPLQERRGSQGSRSDSGANTPRGPEDARRPRLNQSHGETPSPGPYGQGRPDDDARSVHSESGHVRSRPSSVTSHVSTASEIVSVRQRKPEEVATQRMVKARSQESFFEGGQTPQKPGEKGHHKRLLPQPSTSEPSQSFRLKNRNSNNNVSKSGPVKPTHSSVSEVTRLSILDATGEDLFGDVSEYVDESAGELTDRLTQEAQKRKQATELVQQLQKDYDNLLTKYALAELTIDQMRLGAKITLHTDSPTPGQGQSGVMSPGLGQPAQVMSLRQSPSQAVVRNSPAQGIMGHVSPFTDGNDQVDGRPPQVPGEQRSRSRPDLQPRGSISSQRHSVTESEDGLREASETGAETVKIDLMVQAKALDERLESFHALLEQRQLTYEDQEQVFEQIKADHDKLRRTYLQAKDDYNVLRRSGALTNDAQNFDHDKELEGHLFRLGMRFDEVQENVEKSMQERPKRRQPFQPDSNRADDDKRRGSNSSVDFPDGRGGGGNLVDQRDRNSLSRHTSMETAEDPTFEQKVYQMREEYNANMDEYRKLKYLADTPEGEKNIDTVVRRLNEICTEMPDMFRLSPEIQTRCDQMQKENRLKLNDRKNSVWEKLNRREQEMKQQRRSPVPQSPRDGQPPSILRQGSESSDVDSLRARLDGSTRSSLGSILPDRMDRLLSRSNSMTDRPSSRNHPDRPPSRNSNRGYGLRDSDRPQSRRGSKSGDNSFSDSFTPRSHDLSNPNLPRPRRHQHGIRDPQLSQMPDMGSVHSLPDSGISDQENRGAEASAQRRRRSSREGAAAGGGGARGGGGEDAEGALAALPGPGKLKQMTKQRAADDADSGFIGSMVGSGVGGHPVQQQQQQQLQQQQQHQQQQTLRLRRPNTDDSLTATDQSLDISTQVADKPPRSRRRQETNQQRSKGRDRDRMTEESYDGEEDTAETLESDMSLRRGGGARPKMKSGRSKTEQKDLSLDATLEEDDTAESDVSTPRAINQGPSKPKEKERRDSGQAPSNQQTPHKARRPSSRAQTASETEEELRNINAAKQRERHNRSAGLQTSDKEETTHRKRLKSPPLPPRPGSRGSPTTDLYHTRERRGSTDIRRSSRAGTEIGRHERQQLAQQRPELRLDQPGPQVERPSSRQGRQSGTSSHPPGVVPSDPRNSEIADRVKEFEERSVGSDVEVGSSVTRASSVASSNRLKALQEEIEKLKEGVAKANEKASQPPHPPQVYHAPAPQQPAQDRRQEPEYFDPFDDPYGFMRMPRRRANSFSGGREREWDEWYWTLPQNRQYDGGDIPLGYAAADAYAENTRNPNAPDRERNTRENVKNRLRQRRMERRHRDPQGEVDGGVAGPDAAASQQPAGAAGLTDEQTAAMYDYYVPSRYSAQGMRQQMASRGYFTTPSGAKIYSSTGEEADNEDDEHIFFSDTGATTQAQNRPWYQIRRAPRPFTSAYGRGQGQAGDVRLTQSQEDLSFRNWVGSSPQYRAQTGSVPNVAYRTANQACPMCGGAGYHTHANYIHTGQPYPITAPPQYSAHTFDTVSSPVRGTRPRSRSASRTRHYSPERSHSRTTRYKVREYSHLSDSDGEGRSRRRSRSLSRGRSKGRSQQRNESRRSRRRSESLSDLSGEEEVSLGRSLSLSVDISRLTQKMLGTLRTELKRSKDKREFGSSYW